jgi:hydrogenase-4 component H
VNLIRLLLDHLREGPVTVRLPQHVPTGPGYRGLVYQQASGCLGCGICAYVCAPGAIEIHRNQRSYDWMYEPGKCTFCARCVLDCPGQVLSMSTAAPPPYSKPGELRTVVTLPYPVCPRCGRPALPMSEPLLDRALGAAGAPIREWTALCVDCRRKTRAAELLKVWNGAPGKTDSEPLA